MSSSTDVWAGCPAGAQPVMVFCERPGHRKFLGRGYTYQFADGFRSVAFDPEARYITRTGITHADGGVTFRFRCPFRGCSHMPQAREEKLGEYLADLAELGRFDTKRRLSSWFRTWFPMSVTTALALPRCHATAVTGRRSGLLSGCWRRRGSGAWWQRTQSARAFRFRLRILRSPAA